MHVLVTGGAGFIGRHLVPILLERGHDVSIVDSLTENIHGPDPQLPSSLTEDSRFVRADIRDTDAWRFLSDAAPDAVIHLAAETGVGQSMYEIRRYTDVNIQGTATMLDAVRESVGGVERIVLASSRAVYGEGSYRCERCGIVTPLGRSKERLDQGLWEAVCPMCNSEIVSIATSEDAPRVPTSVYAMTKCAQEDLVTIAGPIQGATMALLRYTNVYGEGQPLTNPYTGVLSAFALRSMKGEYPRVYEDGQPTRDFVHVSDVAEATAGAVESSISGTVNVGSGERWSLEHIAAELTRVFGMDTRQIEITGQYRIGDIRHFEANIERARRDIGFEPVVGLDEGLRRFAAWAASRTAIPTTDISDRAERELLVHGLLGIAKGQTDPST